MNKRVALIGDNTIEYVKKLLEVWNKEECAVLIDWRTPYDKIREIISDTYIQMCIVDMKLFDVWKDYCDTEVEFYDSSLEDIQCLPKGIKNLYRPNYSKKEALILFSSGTTGKAKGVVLSYFAINTNADMIMSYMKPSSLDCIFISKILVHSSTVIGELLIGLKSDMRIILSSVQISIRKLLNSIVSNKATIICINPTIASLLIEYFEYNIMHLSDLKKIYISGAILSATKQCDLKKYVPNCNIINVYGLTEAGPRVSAQTDENSTWGSVGVPICNVKVKIVDEEFKEVKYGKVGRVFIKTPSVFTRYVNADARLYDGWIDSKDIGYYGGNNELFIIGRSDEVIIKGGCNIYPSTIENIILKYTKVTECYVFGYKDELYGEIIVCIYTANNLEEVNNTVIKRICEKYMLKHEVPDIIIYTEKIIRNINGKIDIKKNKEWFYKKYIGEE